MFISLWVLPILGLLLVALTVAITYYATSRACLEKAHAARIEAVREKAIRETQDKALSELHTEQQQNIRTTGILGFQKRWLVINERLFFRDIAVSGWVKHEVLLDTQLDQETIETLAKAASFFLAGPNGKFVSTGLKSVASVMSKKSPSTR